MGKNERVSFSTCAKGCRQSGAIYKIKETSFRDRAPKDSNFISNNITLPNSYMELWLQCDGTPNTSTALLHHVSYIIISLFFFISR